MKRKELEKVSGGMNINIRGNVNTDNLSVSDKRTIDFNRRHDAKIDIEERIYRTTTTLF